MITDIDYTRYGQMADSISTSTAVQTNLLALQRAAGVRNESARRLSTGLEVERATDGPSAFFQSQALTNRVSGLFEAKDNIGQALSAVEGALNGIDALTEITQQLRGIALAARGGSAETREAAASQFNALREQLGNLAQDATFQGTGLIQNNPESLTVTLNETGSSNLTVVGAASDASGLGIGDALASYNNFASDADIEAALNDLSAAASSLRSTASSFGTDIALLGIREDFASNLGSTLEAGAAKLVNADLNEEAARQLSSQVRQDLSTLDLRIAAQSEQQVAQILFASS